MNTLDQLRTITCGQYGAALDTMRHCTEACPDEAWDRPIANHMFCQVVFHTLFFLDLYLHGSMDGFREQVFHREHTDVFRDYEELEPKKPEHLYERPWILSYHDWCRQRVDDVVAAETEASLAAPVAFPWLEISRAELHVYTIRHIQHHAAQLALRLRLDDALDTPWFKTG